MTAATALAPAPGTAGREPLRDLSRAAAGPLICAIILTGLLTAWVAASGAGTLTRIRLQITLAAVPMRGFTPGTAAGPAATFLTIRNLSGTPDKLIAVRSPIAPRIVLTRPGGLVIPAHGTITLSPGGDDLVLRDPSPYENRPSVPLTLTFLHSGTVTIQAAVTAPGTPLLQQRPPDMGGDGRCLDEVAGRARGRCARSRQFPAPFIPI